MSTSIYEQVKNLRMEHLVATDVDDKLDRNEFREVSSTCLSTSVELTPAFAKKLDVTEFQAVSSHLSLDTQLKDAFDSKADKNTDKYDLDDFTLGQYLSVLTKNFGGSLEDNISN